MTRRTLILKSPHAATEILALREGDEVHRVVERWQKATIHYRVHGRLPSVTYKLAEKPNDLVACMVESTRL